MNNYVNEFISITNCNNEKIATKLLKETRGNLQAALNIYFSQYSKQTNPSSRIDVKQLETLYHKYEGNCYYSRDS
ncbi:hypothetical protein BKA69DRAFT_251101 [Paraphysoderma sedebokerense]|nr:hypothetical protein BKA69DRAFT_251101 [Paraphysoderma sedebokerense]